jgi:ATP-dependent RNA helicase DeaD
MDNTAGAPPVAPSDYVSQASFDDFALSEPVRRAIAEHGYEKPTPVQAATYRPVRDGKDVIVRSKTGTGKTAAFAIPILERVPEGRRKPSALVMCPTRELAIQVAEEFTALAKHRDLSVVAVYGGASMGEQLQKLEAGAEIVVGTPGRIYDHIRRRTLKLDDAMVCCLDEADEMLNMGFFEEVTRILDNLPKDCQQLLFSATVPADIEQIIHDYLTDPETILLSGDEYSVENIHNVMYPAVDAYPKPRNLLYMIEMEEPETAIVFCNTRNDTSLVAAVLNRNGYDAELLNGDLPQKERERVMAKVKRGEVRFMVATDIAARGIDISDLSHVINYSLPEDPAVFLHRVGRTGRIGKKGTSLSIVSGAEIHTLTVLQKKFGITFEERRLPTPEEARRLWTDRHVAELKEAMSSSIFEAFIPLSQELRNRPDGEYLVAFALKYFFTHHRMERAQDREKAEHKREEHVRREQGEGRREGRGRERGRSRRGERERPARGERAERSREPHRERGEAVAASGDAGASTRQAGASREIAVEVVADAGSTGPREGGRPSRRGRGERRREAQGEGEGGAPAGAVEGAAAADGVAAPGNGAPPGGAASADPVDRPQRAKIFLSLGEQDGVDEDRVREAVTTLAPGIEPRAVEVRRTHSFVEVAPEGLDAAVVALNGKEWSGKTLTAERARRRRR